MRYALLAPFSQVQRPLMKNRKRKETQMLGNGGRNAQKSVPKYICCKHAQTSLQSDTFENFRHTHVHTNTHAHTHTLAQTHAHTHDLSAESLSDRGSGAEAVEVNVLSYVIHRLM